MFLFRLVLAMSLCASVYMCFVVTCWEWADLLVLVCHFPIGILGQVWYLIVSIPVLYTLTYLVCVPSEYLNQPVHLPNQSSLCAKG